MKQVTLFSSFLLLFSLNLIGRYPTDAQNNSLNARTLFDVGVVLDLESPLGKMSNICISMALEDFYTTHNNYTTELILHWRDSKQDIVDAASMALDLLKNVPVKAIIGPETSAQAQFMAELGNRAHVPILSFSATSPLLSTITTPYFIRTGQSDLSQVKAIIAIIQAFGWKEVVPIYEDTPYENGLIPNFTTALQEVNIRVPYKSVISHQATDDQIERELFKLETIQTRVFVVHLSPSLSSRLFFKANKVRMMSEGHVWIITDGLANVVYSMNSPVIQSMQGVLGARPYIPKSKELDDFKERYCIYVFKAAIERLPYAINYKFIPFVDKYGRQAGTYDDLIYQVYRKNFEAVVGDTTILANRSQYVDFTLPYTQSGATLLVLANDNRKKAWIFLQPPSWDLWLMTGAAFVFTSTVVWPLEHRINNEFRGPIADQVGTMLWFSFSTLIFAHRERVVSNWSRIVVIIWLFVVLILTSSYTASLTSMLTIQQLLPSINDIDDLIKNRENVGYQKGSCHVDILRRLKVEESKLKPYETLTAEEYSEALSKGTKKGGVGAIFDEIHTLRIFLAKNGNCAKYKMVGPIYKTDGFGFAFPRGSPLKTRST
ncbi:hypothetical protein AAC387_Pa03g0221 [Persea americana]